MIELLLISESLPLTVLPQILILVSAICYGPRCIVLMTVLVRWHLVLPRETSAWYHEMALNWISLWSLLLLFDTLHFAASYLEILVWSLCSTPFEAVVYFLCLLLWDTLLLSFRLVSSAFLVLLLCPVHLSNPDLSWYLELLVRVRGSYTCDEHPKKLTVAQAATPTSNVPSEVRSL